MALSGSSGGSLSSDDLLGGSGGSKEVLVAHLRSTGGSEGVGVTHWLLHQTVNLQSQV